MPICWLICCATDGHRWAPLSPQSDSIRALRALVRARDDLVANRVALGNQLLSTLELWPGAACIFADITSPIALAFLLRYPSPAAATRLNATRLQRFCRLQHYSGRRSAAELLARLHAAAPSLTGPQASEALAQVVASLVHVLQPLIVQISELTRRIEHFVESAARRADHHVLPTRRPYLCCANPGRARRCARTFLHGRAARRRSRCRPRYLSVR